MKYYYKVNHVYCYLTREQYNPLIREIVRLKIGRRDEYRLERLLEQMNIGYIYNRECAPRGR